MKKREKNNETKVAYSISNNSIHTNELKGKKINFENEGTKFVVILLCIVAFLAMLYLVDTLKNNKIGDKTTVETPSISYSEVLVGNMLNQKYDKYYVYAYNNDKDVSYAQIDLLLSSTEHYYKLNLGKANNLSAVSEKSNFKGTIDQIKFKGETLLLIEKGKITKSFEGAESIIKELQRLKAESNK